MPPISIITAVWNGKRTIERCIESVRGQGVPVEHIVVDGGSTDGTLDVLEAHRASLARIVSEPDHGMYDAMNKGIGLATGDIVGILNADDTYADGEVLRRVGEILESTGADSCYGDLEYVKEEPQNDSGQWSEVRAAGRQGHGDLAVQSQIANRKSQIANDSSWRVVRRWRSGPFRSEAFYWGWMPPHPTFFVRRDVYERFGGFRLDLGTAADYELMLRLLVKQRISCAYVPHVLVHMRTGGRSNVSLAARLRANRMDRRAWVVNELRPYPWTIPLKPVRKLRQYWVGRS